MRPLHLRLQRVPHQHAPPQSRKESSVEGVRRVQAVKVQSTDKRGVSNLPKQVHHAWNNTLEYVYNTYFLRRDKKKNNIYLADPEQA